MWERIRVMVRKEFRQAFREPRTRFLLFMPPVLQLLLLGYAVNLDLENTRIAWVDLDHTPQSRQLRAAFAGSPRFVVVDAAVQPAAVQNMLDHAEVSAAVRVLPGFSRDIQRGRVSAVQVLIEGSNSNTAAIVSGYVNVLLAEFAGRLAADRIGIRAGPRNTGLDPEIRVWFNADLRSRNYFIPGVVATIIFMVTLMLTSMAIVREKELGTLEQLLVTPIRPIELMIGKMLPAAFIGLCDMVLVTLGALVIFHVPFRGNILFLLGCAVLFVFTSLGAGLLLSTVSQTQQQAVMSSFFITMPMSLLSGFMFPIRNMPVAIQYLTYLNPLRYFIEIVRTVFLKGAGLAILWPQVLALTVFGLGLILISSQRFRKRLE